MWNDSFVNRILFGCLYDENRWCEQMRHFALSAVALAMALAIISSLSMIDAWPGMSGAKGANHPPPRAKGIVKPTSDVDMVTTVEIQASADPVGPVVGPICTGWDTPFQMTPLTANLCHIVISWCSW
jgi:hypothetical protein